MTELNTVVATSPNSAVAVHPLARVDLRSPADPDPSGDADQKAQLDVMAVDERH